VEVLEVVVQAVVGQSCEVAVAPWLGRAMVTLHRDLMALLKSGTFYSVIQDQRPEDQGPQGVRKLWTRQAASQGWIVGGSGRTGRRGWPSSQDCECQVGRVLLAAA